MEMLVIEGGRQLSGEVDISGSKNAALPIMIASLLSDEDSEITNVPHLADTVFLLDLLKSFGALCYLENNKFSISPKVLKEPLAHYDVVRKMRASVLVLAPLLSRFGRAQVSLPGGCAIGARPVDIHLQGLSLLGAKIEVKDGYIYGTLPTGSFQGAEIDLPMPSVGATQQLVMAGALALGITVIKNAAKEPEIIDLCVALNKAGANITGFGTSIITIKGVTSLKGLKHDNSPDRIEAGTFIALACATQSNILLKNIKTEELIAVTNLFSKCGLDFFVREDELLIKSNSRPQAIDVETQCYPGFPTDLQPQFMAAMCVALGVSNICERIFENRMMHVPELRRMGAKIDLNHNKAIVVGVDSLTPAQVMASDIRASAGLVIAALCAKGRSEVRRIYHLDRGYESLEKKLLGLNASVKRTKQN